MLIRHGIAAHTSSVAEFCRTAGDPEHTRRVLQIARNTVADTPPANQTHIPTIRIRIRLGARGQSSGRSRGEDGLNLSRVTPGREVLAHIPALQLVGPHHLADDKISGTTIAPLRGFKGERLYIFE